MRCIIRKDGNNKLRWGYSLKGFFSLKESYNLLISNNMNPDEKTWSNIWRRKLWPKITIFSWIVIHNRILTGENLQRHGMFSPYQCPLCEQAEEMMLHLLDSCNFLSQLWDQGAMLFHRYVRICQILTGTLIHWTNKPFLNKILNHL